MSDLMHHQKSTINPPTDPHPRSNHGLQECWRPLTLARTTAHDTTISLRQMTDARTFARVPRTYVLQITAIQTVLGTPTLRSTAGRLQVDALCVEAHDAGSDVWPIELKRN